MVTARGDTVLKEMNFLWENHWMKLNNMWKDPETGISHSRKEAIKIATSRIRKLWIADQQRLRSGKAS